MLPILILAAAATAPTAVTDTWPGFRNDGGGRTAARDLPLVWGPGENLAWRVSTPGYGQSAPVVWKDRVYLTSVDGPEKETLIVSAFAAADGRALWEKRFPATQKGKNNPMQSRAAGTPAADASGVFAFFESGDLIALTPDGDVRWQRALATEFGELKNNHGLGSSPVQSGDAVFVLVDHQGPSYLLAANKADGKTRWKADRPARTSWTSPVVADIGGRPVVVTSSGGAVTAYAATDGAELWELNGLTGNTIPSPTLLGDRLLIGASEGRTGGADAAARSNCCLKLTGGAAPGYEVVWRARRTASHFSSPLAFDGHAYVTDKTGIVHCLDLGTGEERYAERLDNQQWATPIGADGHVFFFGKDGITTVLKAGPVFEKVASNRFWTDADYQARRDAAKKKASEDAAKEPKRPERSGEERGPSSAERDAARNSAVGDVVYGAAAVDGTFFVRTGTELFCVRAAR